MPQLQLPIFPHGLTPITEDLAFQQENGKVVYFHGLLPVFQHEQKDVKSFRIIGESLDPKLVDAYVRQWNFNIQQEVVKQIVLTASYVGSKSTHQPMLRELNPALFGPGATLANVDARRIYAPSLVSISDYESIGASSSKPCSFP